MVDRRKFLINAGIIGGGLAIGGIGTLAFNQYSNYRFRDDGSRICGTNLVTWRKEGFFEINKILEKLMGLTNHVSLVTSYSMRSNYSRRIREGSETPSLQSLEYAIRQIKSLGCMDIMLKPHVNVEDGTRTLIYPGEDFYNMYFKEFIYPLAEFAEKNSVEQLCIGTELMLAATISPGVFEKGINGIRKRFGGKLTFAAYDSTASFIDFWGMLDFIGYNHYNPVNPDNPTLNDMEKDFAPTISWLENLAKKYSKKILFTEYGCTSLDGGAKMPPTKTRRYMRNKRVDFNEQNNYIKGFYNSYWEKSWCLGGDLWCAYNPEEIEEESRNLDYYWLGKPVQATIEERYFNDANQNLHFTE